MTLKHCRHCHLLLDDPEYKVFAAKKNTLCRDCDRFRKRPTPEWTKKCEENLLSCEVCKANSSKSKKHNYSETKDVVSTHVKDLSYSEDNEIFSKFCVELNENDMSLLDVINSSNSFLKYKKTDDEYIMQQNTLINSHRKIEEKNFSEISEIKLSLESNNNRMDKGLSIIENFTEDFTPENIVELLDRVELLEEKNEILTKQQDQLYLIDSLKEKIKSLETEVIELKESVASDVDIEQILGLIAFVIKKTGIPEEDIPGELMF